MPKLENVERLLALLQEQKKLIGDSSNPVVAVGYSMPYAIFVHEDLEANHPNGGQAKYLEQPYRQMLPQLKGMLFNLLRRGMNLSKALLAVGFQLLAASQPLVPVDTGLLKASGYCRLIQ